MKAIILATFAVIALAGQTYADNHGHCTGKDGKKIEAKDEAACKAAGGEWKK